MDNFDEINSNESASPTNTPPTESRRKSVHDLDNIRILVAEAARENQQLRDEAEGKIKDINKIESQFARENRNHQKQVRQYYDLRTQVINKLKNQIVIKLRRKEELQDRLGGYSSAVLENERLKNTLENFKNIENTSMTEKEYDSLKQKSFDMKMKLDRLMRSSITAFEEHSKQHTEDSIQLEKNAAIESIKKRGNDYLEREVNCENLIKKHKERNQAFIKVRLIRDLAISSRQIEKQRVRELEEEIEKANRSNDILKQLISNLEEDLEQLTNKQNKKDSQLLIIKDLNQEYNDLVKLRECQSLWVLKLCKNFLRKCLSHAYDTYGDFLNENLKNETFTKTSMNHKLLNSMYNSHLINVQKGKTNSLPQVNFHSQNKNLNYDQIWKNR